MMPIYFDVRLPRDEIRAHLEQKGHYFVANVFARMGVPFEKTYEAIFNRQPRPEIEFFQLRA